MASVNITYDPVTQQIYVNPPLTVGRGTDREILFSLDGAGQFDWFTPPGESAPITFVSSANAGQGYSDLPGPPNWQQINNSWLLILPPNQEPKRVYYKWMFHLVNKATGWHIDDDPDIGNDPPGS